MRRSYMVLLTLILTVGLALPAYAFLDKTFKQDQGQGQSQGQGQVSVNRNTSLSNSRSMSTSRSDSRANAIQGQAMGQLQGQVSDQGNAQDVTVEGDDISTYVMTAPDTVAQSGQSGMAAYSIFGGLNVVATEEAQSCMEKIACISQMEAAGLMNAELAKLEAMEAFYQLKAATQPKRWCGVGGETRGRHLFNLFGLLACDSLQKAGKVTE